MLLDAVIIVLRETIEAGVLISVLLSMAVRYRRSSLWVWISLLLGLAGSVLYMRNVETLSSWFDYVGQEVVNASLQYLIYISLLLLMCLTSLAMDRREKTLNLLPLMGLIVALALIREGAEVLVFYSGFWITQSSIINPITSGFVGLTIGMSLGGICYYGLTLMPARWAAWVQKIVLTLIAGGMVAQATQLMMQADWLPSAMPLWDTSQWLPEQSLIGTLAYAVLGYEATPTQLQVTIYSVAILLIPLSILLTRWLVKPTRTEITP